MRPKPWMQPLLQRLIMHRERERQPRVGMRSFDAANHLPILPVPLLHQMIRWIEKRAPDRKEAFLERYREADKFWSGRTDAHTRSAAELQGWMRGFFAEHPDLERKYAKRAGLSDVEGSHRSWSWPQRLRKIDQKILRLCKMLRIRPTSFLDVGAGFHPSVTEKRWYRTKYGSEWRVTILSPIGDYERAPFKSKIQKSVPAQTTLDSKAFFDAHGVSMKYTAVDIREVDRTIQRDLLKKGVRALSSDYRRHTIGRTFSIVRVANMSMHTTQAEFVRILSNASEMVEKDGLLVVANYPTPPVTIRVFQKRVTPEGFDLVQVLASQNSLKSMKY